MFEENVWEYVGSLEKLYGEIFYSPETIKYGMKISGKIKPIKKLSKNIFGYYNVKLANKADSSYSTYIGCNGSTPIYRCQVKFANSGY